MKNMIKIKKTKAAILAKSCSPLIIDEIEFPHSLDYGQVLVKVLYTSICGSQLGEIDAKKGVDNYLPHLLGHEACARVMQCGQGVKHVQENDLVVLHWRKGLGIEANPASYMWKGQKVNSGWVTTFSEYSIISENRMTKVPENSPLELLPLLGCAVTTGMGVIVNDAKVRIGESIVIFGAGGVGLNVVQAAYMAGAYPIIAIDLFDNRLELAQKLGASHIINGNKEDAIKNIREILAEYGQANGADICIDNTGNTKIIAQAYELAHAQGRIICVGVPIYDDKINIYTLPLHFGKSITGSHGGGTIPHEDIPRYLKLMHAGKLDLSPFITESYELSEINTAIENMRNGSLVGRCILKCADI